MIAFSVTDTGIGIPPDKLEMIFESFQQVEGSANRQGGTGLGLSICREMSRLLGAEVRVESTLGSGSSFSLLLPLRSQSTTAATAPSQPTGRLPVFQSIEPLTQPATHVQLSDTFDKIRVTTESTLRRVLVVDDDRITQEYLTRQMEERGLEVVVVDTAEKALDHLKLQPVDGIILDLMLPGMSGLELLDTISREPVLHLPPLVIYSGKDLSDEERAQLSRYVDVSVQENANDKKEAVSKVLKFLKNPPVEPLMNKEKQKTLSIQPFSQEKNTVAERRFFNKKVLLVDDDVRNIFAISLVLKQAGMIVLMANNGEKALQILDEKPDIDIVLMDIIMGVIDGFEAIRRIRQQDRFAYLPIIAVTAKAMKEDQEKCLSIGADDYLAKPVETACLLATMERWLDKNGRPRYHMVR